MISRFSLTQGSSLLVGAQHLQKFWQGMIVMEVSDDCQ